MYIICVQGERLGEKEREREERERERAEGLNERER